MTTMTTKTTTTNKRQQRQQNQIIRILLRITRKMERSPHGGSVLFAAVSAEVDQTRNLNTKARKETFMKPAHSIVSISYPFLCIFSNELPLLWNVRHLENLAILERILGRLCSTLRLLQFSAVHYWPVTCQLVSIFSSFPVLSIDLTLVMGPLLTAHQSAFWHLLSSALIIHILQPIKRKSHMATWPCMC